MACTDKDLSYETSCIIWILLREGTSNYCSGVDWGGNGGYIVMINLTKAEIAYNFSGSDLINDYEYTVINFYNNNLILIMCL